MHGPDCFLHCKNGHGWHKRCQQQPKHGTGKEAMHGEEYRDSMDQCPEMSEFFLRGPPLVLDTASAAATAYSN